MLRQMGRCNLANPKVFLEVDFFVHSPPLYYTTTSPHQRQRQELRSSQGNDKSATYQNLSALCRLTSSLVWGGGRCGVRRFPFRTHPALYTRSRKDRRPTLPNLCCKFGATPPANASPFVPRFGARDGISYGRARSLNETVCQLMVLGVDAIGDGDQRQGNNRT